MLVECGWRCAIPFPFTLNKKLMVSIDRVYQTVLSILNKEQRGYVTPEEFNRYAVQAQKEIYDDYFFKIGRSVQAGGLIDPSIANIPFDILEKIQDFEFSQLVQTTTSLVDGVTQAVVPITGATSEFVNAPIYRLEMITSDFVEVTKVSKSMLGNLLKSTLTQPTIASPIYYRIGGHSGGDIDSLRIYGIRANAEIDVFYYRELADPLWVGATMGGQAVVNTAGTGFQNFELHTSEEPELVAMILAYAGITVRDPEVASAAGQKAQQISQQQS